MKKHFRLIDLNRDTNFNEAEYSMSERSTPSTLTNFADLMDSRFTIPGTGIRYGVDTVIGLIPGIGDWLGGLVSLYFPVHAAARDVSAPVIFRMFINILLDIAIGSVPLLGDLFDLSWKANTKNARLLQEYQSDPEKTGRQSRWLNWLLVVICILFVILLLLFIGWIIAEILGLLF